MKPNDAQTITGSLSAPSKMPCFAYSIPAQACRTGSRLHQTENTVCSDCYALKGNYHRPNVKVALARRLASLDHPDWVPAMVVQILAKESSGFFRWHDSGDLQSVAHLAKICAVCLLTPAIRHWLPTREYGIVQEYLAAGHTLPANLTVRLSAYLIDGPLPTAAARRLGVLTSSVVTKDATCPAPLQGNQCGECRACWSKSVPNVAYLKH